VSRSCNGSARPIREIAFGFPGNVFDVPHGGADMIFESVSPAAASLRIEQVHRDSTCTDEQQRDRRSHRFLHLRVVNRRCSDRAVHCNRERAPRHNGVSDLLRASPPPCARPACALAAFCVADDHAEAQAEVEDDRGMPVARRPSQTWSLGAASVWPEIMRSITLQREAEHRRTFAFVLEPDEDPIALLTDVAHEYQLASCQITTVGGFSQATLGYFDRAKHVYRNIPLTEQVEVLSLIGDIAHDDGKARDVEPELFGDET
jgi:hypothetical protein